MKPTALDGDSVRFNLVSGGDLGSMRSVPLKMVGIELCHASVYNFQSNFSEKRLYILVEMNSLSSRELRLLKMGPHFTCLKKLIGIRLFIVQVTTGVYGALGASGRVQNETRLSRLSTTGLGVVIARTKTF